jgi:hypothetical protein
MRDKVFQEKVESDVKRAIKDVREIKGGQENK